MRALAVRQCTTLVILALLASLVCAGELNPPGAPAPTANLSEPRTPISSLPFSIDEPGSYYLTTSLTGEASQNGITVNSDNVTIDLCGFTLSGVPNSYVGINVPLAGPGLTYQNVVVRNGTVRDWGSTGIDSSAQHGRFEQLFVTGNGYNGMYVGADCLILSCQSNVNINDGIVTDSRCQVIQCQADFNGSDGIVANAGSLVRGCTATENTDNGILMFNAGLCLDNICERNGRTTNKAGIAMAGSGHRIEGNLLLSNGVGITSGGGSASLIIGNAVCNTIGADFDVTSGNFTGTIVTTSGGMATANAWANFAY